MHPCALYVSPFPLIFLHFVFLVVDGLFVKGMTHLGSFICVSPSCLLMPFLWLLQALPYMNAYMRMSIRVTRFRKLPRRYCTHGTVIGSIRSLTKSSKATGAPREWYFSSMKERTISRLPSPGESRVRGLCTNIYLFLRNSSTWHAFNVHAHES
jgi:hypothetical protein